LFAFLFLVPLLLAGGQTDPQAAGLQALDHQDYQQAEQIFSKIVAADPKDFSACFNLALAETALKKDDQAIEHYKQALTLKPGLYEAELNLGMVYLRDHRPADAIPLLREASGQKPTQARPKRYLGDGLLAIEDFAGAAQAYRDALAIDPKIAVAELGLGQSLIHQGKLEEALPHYRQAAVLDPNLKSFLLELAVAFSKANRPDDAVALLKEFPNDPGAREELGRIYLAASRPADAVIEFEAACQISPTPENKIALATAYLKNKQLDLAAPILEQALAAHPEDFELHMVVGRLYRDKREFAKAANQFTAAAQITPDSVQAWNEAAASFVLAELYPQALAALDKIHTLNAETAGDFYFRAIVLDKLRQVKPALANYQRFLQLSEGKFPDQEFIARQRSRILAKEANR
jgi:tetratricopeptide (TPR) repeat protein